MTWAKIDDGFEDNAKVAPLSDSAHRLWFLACCWCKKPKNAHTGGFVPAASLQSISQNRYKPTQLKKLVQELVGSNVGGTKEHGLWEPRDGGWQFHDWDEYRIDCAPTPPKTPASQSIAGKRSAERRRELYGTAQPRSSNDVRPNGPERPPNDLRTAFDRTDPNGAEPERRTPDPIPDPRSLKTHSEDLTGIRDPFGDSFERASVRELELFEAWKDAAEKPGACIDDSRKRIFLELDRIGFTSDQIREVVAGAKKDDWAVQRGLAPACILGSAEQREKYTAMARASPTKSKHQPPQPNDESNRYQPPVI